MPKKVLTYAYKGDTFTVVNTWFNGASLYHNNQLIDCNGDLLSLKKNVPFMRANVLVNGVGTLIEIFAYAVINVKLQMKINGEYVVGDVF